MNKRSNYKRGKRREKVICKEYRYPLINQGRLLTCVVTAPVKLEAYRVKEAFDRTYVGNKEDAFYIPTTAFTALDESIKVQIIDPKAPVEIEQE